MIEDKASPAMSTTPGFFFASSVCPGLESPYLKFQVTEANDATL